MAVQWIPLYESLPESSDRDFLYMGQLILTCPLAVHGASPFKISVHTQKREVPVSHSPLN